MELHHTNLAYDIERRIKEGRPYTIKELLKLYGQMVSAFRYLQEKNIANRDIKPNNVLLDKDGNVIIADTGGSILVGNQYKIANLYGTLQYTSPELEKLWIMHD